MDEQGELEVTNDQLAKICEYAERVRVGEEANTKTVAFAAGRGALPAQASGWRSTGLR